MSIGRIKDAHEALVTGYFDVAARILEQIIEEAKKQEKREWVGLTDDEIAMRWSWSQSREAEETATTQQHAFAYAIEAKLKEKNT